MIKRPAARPRISKKTAELHHHLNLAREHKETTREVVRMAKRAVERARTDLKQAKQTAKLARKDFRALKKLVADRP